MSAPQKKNTNGITWGAALLLAIVVFLGVGKASADSPDTPPACPTEAAP